LSLGWPRVKRRARLRLLTRFTIVAAGAVAVTAVAISAFAFVAIRGNLEGQMRQQLAQHAARIEHSAAKFHGNIPDGWVSGGSIGFGSTYYSQVISSTGAVRAPKGDVRMLTPDSAAISVAAGRSQSVYQDATVEGVKAMVLTVPLSGPQGLALQVAEPLTETDSEMATVGAVLSAASLIGILAAAAIGWAVARTGLAPVSRLAAVAEQVTATGDADLRVEVDRSDEIGRLATSFNRMLSALQRSLATQRRLISDASHELRTPLASLRVNVELLADDPGMSENERKEVLDRVVAQVGELSGLVASVTDLARGEPGRGGRRSAESYATVRLDETAATALEAARRDWPSTEFRADLDRCVITGDADRLRVAIRNLLDNAAKFGPPGGPVEVRLSEGELTVRDHGPGINPADEPYVFDRFYRAPEARAVPGSGLGLSVVSDVTHSHGGTATAESAPDGGALFRLTFPCR
jgi:two-component system sensor histidine kinase MprB